VWNKWGMMDLTKVRISFSSTTTILSKHMLRVGRLASADDP